MDERYNVAQVTEETPFGQYIEAEDTFIQRKVQIFRFNTPTDGDPEEWKETFGSSAAELGTISHPGLPIIYESGIDEDGPFAIRQLVEATSLNKHLVENGQLTEYEGWEFAHQLLEIHDAAASSNNFHGSLDANHVGFTTRPSGEKRYAISDYGLAEIYNRMHKTNDYFGASYLISPEQLNGESPSEQSQLYTIGQLIFHALCGGHPWTNVAVEEIANQAALEPINAYNDSIPEEMVEWLSQLIANNPEDRFSSYSEAFEALPAPIQSAPIPINATSAVFQTPVTQPVSNQPANTTGVVAAAAATNTTALQPASEQSSSKKPIIIGAAALLLVVIIVIFASGGDDEASEAAQNSNSTPDKGSLTEGRIALFDFDSESLKSEGAKGLSMEPLKLRADFAKKGLQSKGRSLKLSKSHYFRIPIGTTEISEGNSDYSICFWVMPTRSGESNLSVLSKQPWEEENTKSLASDKHLWTPKSSEVYGNDWNLITMVFSAKEGTVQMFLDGDSKGSATTIGDAPNSNFIYIGCNSDHESTQKSPVLIDKLSIWNKKLSQKEIKEIYYEE